MDWKNEATIADLRRLWAEGHTTAEIGRRMGASKNSIVGAAHRNHLPVRPSPIRRKGADEEPTWTRRVVPPPSGPTLRPLVSVAPAAILVTTPIVKAPPSGAPAFAPLPHRSFGAPAPYRRIVECQWPIGDVGTKAFHYCEHGALPGRPYCQEHSDRAFVRVRDRHDDAAA